MKINSENAKKVFEMVKEQVIDLIKKTENVTDLKNGLAEFVRNFEWMASYKNFIKVQKFMKGMFEDA